MKKLLFLTSCMAFFNLQSLAQINTIEYAEAVMPAERLSNNVNSAYAERLPIISPDGQTLFFARKYHPDNIPDTKHKDPFDRYKDDIYVSYRQPNGRWSLAGNMGGPLNNDNHNFVIAVSPDGRTLYLAGQYSKKGNIKQDGVSYSRKTPYGWSKPKALDIKNMYNKSPFVGYHVSVNQRVIVMAAERNDTEGDRDLYVSFKYADGSWTEPQNMGTTINTKGMEASVFIAADNKTIYFSSEGHPGYGGLDVFMSRRLDNTWTKWSKPLNLGKQINTNGNDYNYTVPASGEYAYFSSDIGSPNLMSNLYRIRLPKEVQPEPVTLVKARLVDAETGQPLAENSDYQMVVSDSKEPEALPEISGYFPVREQVNVVEEIDYDGDDPEIIAQINPQKKEYTPSPEVEALKKKLASLEQDLAMLDEERSNTKTITRPPERERYSDNFRAPRSSFYEEEKARKKKEAKAPKPPRTPKTPKVAKLPKEKPVKKEETPVAPPPEYRAPLTRKAPVKDDYRLRSLKERYNDINKPETEDDYELAKMKKLFSNTHYDTEESEPDPMPERLADREEPDNDFDDEEEEEVEIRVIKNPEVKSRPRPTTTRTRPAQKKNKAATKPAEVEEEEQEPAATIAEEPAEEEDELAALRRKMGMMYEDKPPKTSEAPKKTRPAKPKPPKQPVAEEAPIVKKEVPQEEEVLAMAAPEPMPSFEELEEQVRKDLEKELQDEVRQKLQEELLDDVKNELEDNLKDDIRDQLEDGMKKDVEDQLRSDLKSNIQDELRDDMRDDVEQKLRDDMRKDVEDDLRNKLRQDIENELRQALKDEIEQDLRTQLADPVKDQLRQELEYRLKKEVEQKLRKELEEKIRRQQKERERDIALNTQQADGVNPSPAPEYRELEEDIKLYPIKVGQIIPLNSIYFDANKSTLKEESSLELARAVDFLQKNPNVIVEISGHTNGLCSHEFARELSKGRSGAVANYITNNGIHKDRLRFKGYGKTMPIASNDTVEGRRKNQRVEMKILEIKEE